MVYGFLAFLGVGRCMQGVKMLMVHVFQDDMQCNFRVVLALLEGFYHPACYVVSGALPRKGSSDFCAETFDAVRR
jgi:hypothetical protein